MKKYSFLIVLIALFLLTGCPGASDYNIHLPDNLRVSSISANNIVLESYDETGIGTNIVPAQVTKVGWDEHYVVAEQVEDGEDFYWIIEVKSQEAIGPLNDEDFKRTKREVHISDQVQLKDLNQYEKEYDF